jgi:hypothetical protein
VSKISKAIAAATAAVVASLAAAGIDIPTEVEAAVVTLIVFIATYLAPKND